MESKDKFNDQDYTISYKELELDTQTKAYKF